MSTNRVGVTSTLNVPWPGAESESYEKRIARARSDHLDFVNRCFQNSRMFNEDSPFVKILGGIESGLSYAQTLDPVAIRIAISMLRNFEGDLMIPAFYRESAWRFRLGLQGEFSNELPQLYRTGHEIFEKTSKKIQNCAICEHKYCEQIEESIANGTPVLEIIHKYGVPESELYRHATRCMLGLEEVFL